MLLSFLNVSSFFLGNYSIAEQRDMPKWSASLAGTLLTWLTIVGWMIFLAWATDCEFDSDGSWLPWSLFSADTLPHAQQHELNARGLANYPFPDIVHSTHNDTTPFDHGTYRAHGEWMRAQIVAGHAGMMGPYQAQTHAQWMRSNEMTAQGAGVQWSAPAGPTPPRPSRAGAYM